MRQDGVVLKHIEVMRAYIKTLMSSKSFHALVVESPPGWGKSTTIDMALSELGIEAVSAGSYATPLHIYNTLCSHRDKLIILDDCAGLFSDSKSMAILKAATWQSSGQGTAGQAQRCVRWGSTSDRVKSPSVDFAGKLILLTNTVPAGKETEAFISRSLRYEIAMGADDIKNMLLTAASSKAHYADSELALRVARFLTETSTGVDLSKMNLRTLKMGYELAATHPEVWPELLLPLLPKRQRRNDAISTILQSELPVCEQQAKFMAVTGKSRRTYYIYKKRLGLTRKYQVKVS